MTVIAPLILTSLVMTSNNNFAKQQAALATYKQTGMERQVNIFVKSKFKKEWEKPVGYIYQANEVLLHRRITISFSF